MTLHPSQPRDNESLRAHQLDKLKELLAALVPNNRFYTRKLGVAGVGASLSSLEEFTERFPLTSKRELVDDQLQNPPYGSNLTFPLERYTRFHQTSSTSGTPLRWLDTPESWAWMLDNWQTVYEAAGVIPQDRVFFAFSFGPFLGFWTAFDSAARLGCLCIPGGGMRSVARLRAILASGATVLCCTPTYAARLAEVAGEEQISLSSSSVKRIIVAGEPGGSVPSTRALIEKLWAGARVVDHHGMTEIGPVSYECSKRQGVLHVIGTAFIAEVIDPSTGHAVPPGGQGELVLTNLGRTGSPLLRYRTSDIVRRTDQTRCECGSDELALEGGVLGRSDDMVVVRGVNVYPTAIEEVLRGCPEVVEYRVEVRSDHVLSELHIQVEPPTGHGEAAGLEHKLEAALNSSLGLRVAVSIVPRGTLPRFEMKAKRWVKV